MRWLKRHWHGLALGAVFIALGIGIVTFLVAPPSSVPREEDTRAAARIEPQRAPDARRTGERPEGEWVGGLGIIEPAHPPTNLAPAVGGRIAAIHVEEGDTVEPGQVLVELESGPEQAAVFAAQADLARAEAQLDRTRRGAREEEVAALEEMLEAARARQELARTNFARIERLHEMGAVARQEHDRAVEAQQSAASEVAAARARIEAASAGRPEDIRDASAAVLAARARLGRATAELERFTVRAPIHATVLHLDKRVGEHVEPNASAPVMVLGDLRTLRARVDVDERDLGAVRLHAPAVITSDSYPGRFFRGAVVDVGEMITQKDVFTDDPTTRLDVKVLEVIVELEDREGIVPGMRVTGYIASPSEPPAEELAQR